MRLGEGGMLRTASRYNSLAFFLWPGLECGLLNSLAGPYINAVYMGTASRKDH